MYEKNRKVSFIDVYSYPEGGDTTRYQEELERRIENKITNAKNTELITNREDNERTKYLGLHAKRAKNDKEERGINVLYLSFGLLEWYENKKQKEPNYSPLLFVPIQLSRKNVFDKYHIKFFDEEVIENELIMNLLMKEYKIKLPQIPDYMDAHQLIMYLQEVEDCISSLKGWKVHHRTFVGIFSFSSIRLYKDMDTHHDLMYSHPIIRSIAESGRYYQEIPEIKFGDDIDPSMNYSVLDNDSSQEKAIRSAIAGVSMIIKGPPGTGKSQTITNIIAEGLSQGKKILFVAQKMAALEVVKSRLDKLGLGHFTLELHAQEVNKRGVLEQIRHALGVTFQRPEVESDFYDRLRLIRDKLNQYVGRVNEQMGKNNESLLQLVGKYLQFMDVPLVKARLMDAENYSVDQLFEIRNNLSSLNQFSHYLKKANIPNRWASHEVYNYNFGPGKVLDNINYLETLTAQLEKKYRSIRRHMVSDISVSSILDYLNLGEINPDIFQFELIDLLTKFQSSYNSPFRIFKSSYRKDKNLMQYFLHVVENPQIRAKLEVLVYFQLDVFSDQFDDYQLFDTFVRDSSEIFSQMKITIQSLQRDIDLGLVWDENMSVHQLATDFDELFELADHEQELRDWQHYNFLIEFVENTLGVDFLKKLSNLKEFSPFERIFDKRYYQLMAEQYISQLDLDTTDTELLSNLVSDFREIDGNSLEINQIRLLESLFDSREESMNNMFLSTIETSEIAILEKELAKKTRIKPLRQLFTETKNYITELKPCWLMSPLSIANYLAGEEFHQFFDMVIFDEASQIPPHEAIGSILRGKQLIVVGDEKQMPPTAFFGGVMDYEDENGSLHAYESILDELSGVGLPETILQWHYRSKKERLITFSNFHYYDDQLTSFPDTLKTANHDAKDVELLPAHEFRYIPHGLYDRGATRKNHIEAKEVVTAIIEHLQIYQKERYSLGVITFSSAQAEAIEQELERRMRADATLAELVAREEKEGEPLFIKNLENVQGDERDFIFFSIGYANDKAGKMTKNFGPLNQSGGERRLNVAITRARYHIKLFSSFDPDLIDCSNISSVGFNHLMQFMQYVKHTGTLESSDIGFSQSFPLQEDLSRGLLAMGYDTDIMVGSGNYKIDVAVVNPSNPSQYILAIECDGGSFATSKTARDRLRIRHSVLQSLGWQIFHLFILDWYRDRETQLVLIRDMIEDILENKMSQPVSSKIANIDELLQNNSWEVEKLSKTQRRDPHYRKKYLDLPGVFTYQIYSPHKAHAPNDIYDEEIFNKVKNEILAVEGPIHRDLLIARMLPVFGKPKRSKQLRDYLQIELFDEFHYPGGYEGESLRIALDTKQDPRKFEQINQEEIAYAIQLILKETLIVKFDDLVTQVLNIFGVKSRNDKIMNMISQVISQLEVDGILQEGEGEISLNL